MFSSQSETDTMNESSSEELSAVEDTPHSRCEGAVDERWKKTSFKLTKMPSLRSATSQNNTATDQHLLGISTSAEYPTSCESNPVGIAESSDYAASASSSDADDTHDSNQTPLRTLSRRLSIKGVKSITRVSSVKIRRALLRRVTAGSFAKAKSPDASGPESMNVSEKDSSVEESRFSGHSSHFDASSLPHYLNATSSSASKELCQKKRVQGFGAKSTKNKNERNLNSFSDVSNRDSAKGLTRRPSFKPLSKLSKSTSLRSRRSATRIRSEASWIRDSAVNRATCSSALKVSKFSVHTSKIDQTENNPLKVCPYAYCSLHGHRHKNVPSLQRLISIRRRLRNTPKLQRRRMKHFGVKTPKNLSCNAGCAPDSSNSKLVIEAPSNHWELSYQSQTNDIQVAAGLNQGLALDTTSKLLQGVHDGGSASTSNDGSPNKNSVLKTLEFSESEPAVGKKAIPNDNKIMPDETFHEVNSDRSKSSACISDSELHVRKPDANILSAIVLPWEQDLSDDLYRTIESQEIVGYHTEQTLEQREMNENKNFNDDTAGTPFLKVHVKDENRGFVAAFVSNNDPAMSNSVDDFLYKESQLEMEELSMECKKEPSVVNRVISTCQKDITSDADNRDTETECGSNIVLKKCNDVPELESEQLDASPLPAFSGGMQLLNTVSNSKKQRPKSEYRFSQGFPLRGNSANPTITHAKHVKIWNIIYQSMMNGPGFEAEISQSVNTDIVDDDTVKLVQQAFDNILSEIPDNTLDEQSTGREPTLEFECVEDRPNDDGGRSIAKAYHDIQGDEQDTVGKRGEVEESNTSEQGEAKSFDRSTSKRWSNLKKVLLLRKFFSALEDAKPKTKEKFSPSDTSPENERVNKKHRSGEDRKNTEDWMLDNALRQVILTLAPTQRRKVASLVQAFETVIPEAFSAGKHKNYASTMPARPSMRAYDRSSLEMEIKSEKDLTSQNFSKAALRSLSVSKEGEVNVNELRNVKETTWTCFQEDRLNRESKIQLSNCDDSISFDHKYVQENGKLTEKGKESLDFNIDIQKIDLEEILIEDDIAYTFDGLTSNEHARRNLIYDVVEPGLEHLSLNSGNTREVKTDNMTNLGILAGKDSTFIVEKHNVISLRNLIHKHMVSSLDTRAEISKKVIHMEEEDSSIVDDLEIQLTCSGALKLVQQAFDQILSEIPNQSSGDQSFLIGKTPAAKGSKNMDREDDRPGDPHNKATENVILIGSKLEGKNEDMSTGNIELDWCKPKSMNLLKRFIDTLEAVRKINPSKPRYLRVKLDPEAEKIYLRHQSMNDRTNDEEWALDYSLRKVISALAPSDRRKVALIVQAFDTILPSPNTGTPVWSSTTTSLHNLQNSSHIYPNRPDETIKQNMHTASTSRTQSSSMEEKRAEEQNDTVNFDLALPHETTARDSSTPKRGFISTWSGDETGTRKQNHIWLWQLVHHRIVKGIEENVKTPNSFANIKEEFSGIEGENSYPGNQSFEARKKNAVRFVQQAFNKILSEIPDQYSDDQTVNNDASAAEVPETVHPDCFDECTSNSSTSTMFVGSEDQDEVQPRAKQDITMDEKIESNFDNTNQKKLRNWSNLKKVILLRRFIKSLESVTIFSPRKSHCLPVDPNPDPEKIHLRHLLSDGRRNSEEWMLDYALRKVISTLAPFDRRKVAFLAQAFDTISLGTDAIVSPLMHAQSASFCPLTNGESQPEYLFSSLLDKAESFQVNVTKGFNFDCNLSSVEWKTHPATDIVSGEVGNGKPSKWVFDSVIKYSDFRYDKIVDWSHPEDTRATLCAYPLPQRSNMQPEISGKAKMQDKKVQTDPELLNEVLVNMNIVERKALLDSGKPMQLSDREFNDFGTPTEDCKINSSAEGPLRLSFQEAKKTGMKSAGDSSMLQNPKYMGLWGLLCKHMVAVEGNQELLEGNPKDEGNKQKKPLGEKNSLSHLIIAGEGHNELWQSSVLEVNRIIQYQQYQNEAVRLVEEAIDEISLSKSPVGSNNGEEEGSIGSPSLDMGNVSCSGITNHKDWNEIKRKPTTGKNWSNVKKLMILKRFLKTVEKVRKFKLCEPHHLTPKADPEVDKVNMKHLDQQSGKDEYDWMLDSTLQEVVAKLTPARKTKVQLLIEAFESVGYQ